MSDTPDQPAPMNVYRKSVTLWEDLRAAVEAEEDWLALQADNHSA